MHFLNTLPEKAITRPLCFRQAEIEQQAASLLVPNNAQVLQYLHVKATGKSLDCNFIPPGMRAHTVWRTSV